MNKTVQSNQPRSSANFRALLHQSFDSAAEKTNGRQILQLKVMKNTGRGGKGHSMPAGLHSWNRKGRW